MLALATSMIAARRLGRLEPQRLGHATADRLLGGVALERHLATDEAVAETTEDEVRVGVRRLLAALP